MDGGSGTGSSVVIFRGEGFVVALFPEDFAAGGFETPEGVFVILVPNGEGVAVGNGEAGATSSDIGLPEDAGAVFLNLGGDFSFGGAIAVRAKVRGPWGCSGEWGEKTKKDEDFHDRAILHSMTDAKRGAIFEEFSPSGTGSE